MKSFWVSFRISGQSHWTPERVKVWLARFLCKRELVTVKVIETFDAGLFSWRVIGPHTFQCIETNKFHYSVETDEINQVGYDTLPECMVACGLYVEDLWRGGKK